MNYLEDLKNAYTEYNRGADSMTSRVEFLGNSLFGFAVNNNYDILVKMSYHSIKVIEALNDEDVGTYIKREANRFWFTFLRNTKFFDDRIAWGGRDHFGWNEEGKYVIKDVDMYIKGKHALDPVKLTHRQWMEFMKAVVEFALPEMSDLEHRLGKSLHTC